MSQPMVPDRGYTGEKERKKGGTGNAHRDTIPGLGRSGIPLDFHRSLHLGDPAAARTAPGISASGAGIPAGGGFFFGVYCGVRPGTGECLSCGWTGEDPVCGGHRCHDRGERLYPGTAIQQYRYGSAAQPGPGGAVGTGAGAVPCRPGVCGLAASVPGPEGASAAGAEHDPVL